MQEENSKLKTALVAGATGLTGKHCLQFLLKNPLFEKVITVGRKPAGIQHPKLSEVICDLDSLDEKKELLKADSVFCCLGTTMKKAGSKKNFQKVDHDYPLKIAQITVEQGAQQFLIITAMGADKDSFFFYNQVKGQVEEDIAKFPFIAIHIFRPSLLLGERNEARAGENAASIFMRLTAPAFKGKLKKYKAIEGKTVAGAMVICSLQNRSGLFVHSSDEIQEIYDAFRTSL